MRTFKVGEKTVEVWPGEPGRPAVYLNTFGHEGGAVHDALADRGITGFTMVAVSDLEWDHDMAPWDIPPISEDDTPCTGGADDYLALMLDRIIPEAEDGLEIGWRGLAGYSLAGLFAVYSVYRTDAFSRIASMSGSLWFPGIVEFIESHEMVRKPDSVFLSLGNKEDRTRNRFLQCVRTNTERVRDDLVKMGIPVEYRLNPGGHVTDALKRSADGIAWMLGEDP